MPRDEDADLRIAMLMERARRAFELPISEAQTMEERLAVVERTLTDLCVIIVGIRASPAPGGEEAFLAQMEEQLLAGEKARGIVPE